VQGKLEFSRGTLSASATSTNTSGPAVAADAALPCEEHLEQQQGRAPDSQQHPQTRRRRKRRRTPAAPEPELPPAQVDLLGLAMEPLLRFSRWACRRKAQQLRVASGPGGAPLHPRSDWAACWSCWLTLALAACLQEPPRPTSPTVTDLVGLEHRFRLAPLSSLNAD